MKKEKKKKRNVHPIAFFNVDFDTPKNKSLNVSITVE